jgi:predicted TIM-barrel fold metal-dependent hydrolase
MTIDANMYWIPDQMFSDEAFRGEFLRTIPGQHGTLGYEAAVGQTNQRQIVIEKPKGYQNLNYIAGEYRLETQLRDLDAAGVDLAVLKTPGCQEWLSLELCRKFNDGLAAHAGRSGGRLRALAVVPPWGTRDCLEELDRCVGDLGMTGVQLSAHYGELYLDDQAFRPFFRRLNDLKLPAYIHHTSLPVNFDSLLDYPNLRRSYGRCADQVTAVSREVFSDLFEVFPDLRFVHSMLGGAFFSYANLMFPKQTTKKDAMDRFQSEGEKFAKRLHENVYFEMSHAAPWGKLQLETAIRVLGADHVLFGSSYPVRREWLIDGPAFVGGLDIAEKDLVLGGNARRLYRID